MQHRIPCIFMRGGTSRGPFLDLRDLPVDPAQRDAVLLRIMGSPDLKQIDGLGGATPVTSKVVMVQPSDRPGIDVDYLFAQVIINAPIVDTKPTCGNMMSGVAPFAIEKGWVEASSPETRVRIYNFNTDSISEMIVQTPGGAVNYTEGDMQLDGVPGTGAPILINLFNIAGGATGTLFPTGQRKDHILGLEVSVVDAGNLILLVKATQFGLTGQESGSYFANHPELMSRIEALRLEVGLKAGLGDVSKSVIPKVGILSAPRAGGHIKSQYLTPHTLHPTHAFSGAVGIATGMKAKGTVAADLVQTGGDAFEQIIIEHQAGLINIHIEVSGEGQAFSVVKAGTLRTARKIMEGFVYYQL